MSTVSPPTFPPEHNLQAANAPPSSTNQPRGDDDVCVDSDDCVALQEPEEALSSLLVLTGDLAEADAYRAVRQSLALSFSLLGLEPLFTLSAFHPKDTFEIKKNEDGTRSWETTLPHPLIHVVKKMKAYAA